MLEKVQCRSFPLELGIVGIINCGTPHLSVGFFQNSRLSSRALLSASCTRQTWHWHPRRDELYDRAVRANNRPLQN